MLAVVAEANLDGVVLHGQIQTNRDLRSTRRNRRRTSPGGQTQAGIGHSAPAHRGRRMQHQEQAHAGAPGTNRTGPEAEQRRADGGPSRKAKACQCGRGRGLAGALRRRHTKQECHDNIQTLQRHLRRGLMAQHGSSRIKQKRHNTSRGSSIGDVTGRKRR